MKALRNLGSLAFVCGLFVTVFLGVPWHVITSTDPVIPLWLRSAIFCMLGGLLVVLASLALEPPAAKGETTRTPPPDGSGDMPVLSSPTVPHHDISEVLGLVQGHTVFAIWLGKDLSAIARLILGGELTEYTDMMGQARATALRRMVDQAREQGADAIINVRYMTTSVVGSAAELLAYGTAVKLST
jgi:uncharacterized protein YbjQ (UPF0145 family)